MMGMLPAILLDRIRRTALCYTNTRHIYTNTFKPMYNFGGYLLNGGPFLYIAFSQLLSPQEPFIHYNTIQYNTIQHNTNIFIIVTCEYMNNRV